MVKSPKYLEIKADRARLYFPLIEKALKEEGVPTDFKYLSLQESALISDAVSSSNAVGFWQFKDFTGKEVGLRIDRSVDERLNIVSATHGAAKYFKRHNFYFDNWIYTLLAHMTGRGGAMKYVDQANFGKKKMTLNGKAHWYIKRFLAHKIAYEALVDRPHSEGLKLIAYRKAKGKTLADLAKDFKTEERLLRKYNKWLKSKKVPGEKDYAVIIPTKGKTPSHIAKNETPQHKPIHPADHVAAIHAIFDKPLNTSRTIYLRLNGLPTFVAQRGERLDSAAARYRLSAKRLARYNDLEVGHLLIAGEVYYLKAKRNRAKIGFYNAQPSDDLWKVAQKFGVKRNRLAKMNRMSAADPLKPGRVLWLRRRRPSGLPVDYQTLPPMPIITPKNTIAQEKESPKETPLTPALAEKIKENITPPLPPPKTPQKQTPTFDSEKIVNHLVKKGETLYAIAKQYGVSVANLLAWNDLKDHALQPGQYLNLHEGKKARETSEKKPEKTQTKFHIVAPGDTLYGISKKYDMPVDQLMRLNQKEDVHLKIGEKIQISEK